MPNMIQYDECWCRLVNTIYDAYWCCNVGERPEDVNFTPCPDADNEADYTNKDKDWPEIVAHCDKLTAKMEPTTALEHIAKQDEPNLKMLAFMLESVNTVHGFVRRFHFDQRKMNRLLDMGIDKKEVCVLGHSTGGSKRVTIIIVVERLDNANEEEEYTCTLKCTFMLLNYHHDNGPQYQWQHDFLQHQVLDVFLMHMSCNGSRWEWTSEENQVLREARVLQKFKVQLSKISVPTAATNCLKYQNAPSIETVLLYLMGNNVDVIKYTENDGYISNLVKNCDKSSATCESAAEFEETECDTREKWTSDSMSSESGRDNEYLGLIKQLPSQASLEIDDAIPMVERADFFTNEQISHYTDTKMRLESFICMSPCKVDIDELVGAGFFFTGESIVCFSCCVCFGDWEHEDPWMEHTKRSPGCDYLRSMKGQDYICHVLTGLTERKDWKHSENHPADAKSKAHLLVEKKFLDPPDPVTRSGMIVCHAGTGQGRTDDYAVQKHHRLGCLNIFDVIKGGKKPAVIRANLEKHLKDFMKCFKDASITETKEGPSTTLVIQQLRELPQDTQQKKLLPVYMLPNVITNVPNVMLLISSYNIWPHRNIRTGPLVEAGFSCKDPNTATVECKLCGLTLDASTLNGTPPIQRHRQESPDCEFFSQTNSQGPDGQRHRALVDAPQNLAESPSAANQESSRSMNQQSQGSNQQNNAHQGQAQGGQMPKAKDTLERTRPGNNNGNIRTDEVALPGNRQQTGNASSLFSNNEPFVAERPRTGEVFDRTALTVPNNNNVTSSGEAVRENENIIAGAQGGDDVPYQIRNPRFTEQHARRESYTHWPHRAAHDIDNLVNAGFFYTGAEDIVRCFCCDIGLAEWNPDDDPWVEHARHSPECPYLRNQKGQDYINNIQAQWARIYTPKHPQYTQMDARRRSYQNAGWPRDNVLQSPEQLAAAGFFYTGEGDTVRCHYCDGGLREWEPTDDPWVEHARWFPFCKFVLKIKGIDFIQASATGNPANGLQAPVAPAAAPQINEVPMTLSYVDKCRIKEQKNPMHSAAAQSMRSMGYSRETIRMVIDKFLIKTGRRDFKAVNLLEIIMEEEEAGMVFPESDGEDNDEDVGAATRRTAAGGLNAIDDEEMDFSPEAMRKENEYLKGTFKCKVCGERERCIVFVPCGHRITCQRCGEQATVCPHCKKRIDQRFKTFLG